jgi:hypothetical protein
MTEKNLPDSYVPDRRLKSYPTEIGSQKFSPDDITLFKIEKTNKLKHHYTSKYEEIQKEYQKLMNEISINERLYFAKHNFQPIPFLHYLNLVQLVLIAQHHQKRKNKNHNENDHYN